MAEKPMSKAELDRAIQRVEDAFRSSGKTLERLTKQRGVAPMLRLLERAAANLERKVGKLGRPGETFTEVQRQAILAQYRAMLLDLQPRMTRVLGETSREAQVESVRRLVEEVAIGEMAFEGVVTPLPLEQAARMAGIIDRDRSSLLRQHDVSVRTYGMDSIGEMESFLGQQFAVGAGYAETVSGVLDHVERSRYRAERIVRTECLVGTTRVDAAMVLAAHRRPYVGPVVEIVTSDGSNLTTTPNHPMLTRRGWVTSGELREGDDLVCHLGQKHPSATRDEDVTTPPPTICEIFDSLAAVGVRKRMMTAQPDFHGDGRDGYVDIHLPFRPLSIGEFTAVPKSLSENIFAPSDSAALAFCNRCGNLLSLQKSDCLCDVSHMESGVTNPFLDGVDFRVELNRESFGRLSSEIPSDNLLCGQIDASLVVTSTASVKQLSSLSERATGASLSQDLSDPNLGTAGFVVNGTSTESGSVQFKRVTSLAVRQFSGHVFNLTTVNGYFSVEGVYTGNTSFAWNASHGTAIDDAAELVDGLMRRWVEYVDDATGRPLDGRVADDSLVLHGQVCFQPTGTTFVPRTSYIEGGTGGFTMPPDPRVNAKLWGRRYAHPPNRPNDRSRLVPWKPDWSIPGYMVVNGQRMDVRKALALIGGREADDALDVAGNETIPDQPLASDDAVEKAREKFAREQAARRARYAKPKR